MTDVSSIRTEIVSGFRVVASFHEAAGNRQTAENILAHAADIARLDGADLLERAESEGDLLTRCAWHAPFRGRQQ